jgi:hypothetical protein
VSSNGNSLFDTAALLACMRYFPEDKAAVSGVLKAYLGLSSAVFQQVYATFVPFRPERHAGSSRDDDASDRAARFVLLVAVVGGAAAVIGAPFFLVREEAFEHREEAFERGDGSDGTENARIDDGSKTGKKTRTELARTALSRLNRLVVALAIFVSVAAAANDPSVVGVPAPPLWVNGAFTLVIITLLIAPFASFAAIGAFGTAKEETRRERSRLGIRLGNAVRRTPTSARARRIRFWFLFPRRKRAPTPRTKVVVHQTLALCSSARDVSTSICSRRLKPPSSGCCSPPSRHPPARRWRS